MHPFTIHLLPNLSKLKYIRITEVSLDRARSVNRLTDITKNKHPYIRQFRQPALGEAAERGSGNLLLQTTPHTGGFLFVGDHRMQLIVKQRQRIPFRQQEIGKGLTKISVEDSSQQPVKGFIVDINIHYLPVLQYIPDIFFISILRNPVPAAGRPPSSSASEAASCVPAAERARSLSASAKAVPCT